MYHLTAKTLATDALVEKFVVRFPQGMRARIHQVANRGRRSMNKEIVARLEHSLANFETVPGEISELVIKPTHLIDIESAHESDKAYAEMLLNNKLREKIAELSYERKRALLKFL